MTYYLLYDPDAKDYICICPQLHKGSGQWFPTITEALSRVDLPTVSWGFKSLDDDSCRSYFNKHNFIVIASSPNPITTSTHPELLL